MAKFRKYTFRPFQIRYAWLEDGIIRTGKTVVDALDDIGARRKFRKQHPHVMPITSADNLNDPALKPMIRAFIEGSHATTATA